MNHSILPAGYRRIGGVDLMQDRRAALLVNLGALAIALILFLLGLVLRPFKLFSDEIPLLLQLLLFLFGLVFYMVLHELTHGVLMRHYSGLRPRYGFNGVYAYAGSDAYFDRRSYRVIALAPVVWLGLLLLFLCCAAPPSFFWPCYLIQITNLSGAAGDLYVCLLLRKLPDDLLVQDSGVAMQFFSAKL